MINARRLEVLEAAQRARHEAECSAALKAFNTWLAGNTSEAECGAWQRYLLHLPIDPSRLPHGMTQAEHDAILAECGPFTEADAALVNAIDQRLPADLVARLNALHD